jgi:hypothetical protein
MQLPGPPVAERHCQTAERMVLLTPAAPHRAPQLPQLSMSVLKSAQKGAPPSFAPAPASARQMDRGGGQPQAPPTHWSAPQSLPHEPQLCGSSCRLTQAAPHCSKPGSQ